MLARLAKTAFNAIGLDVRRTRPKPSPYEEIYRKYQEYTMCEPWSYMSNLGLAASVTVPGCVIECGVWKGGTSAGMAEVMGGERKHFLFDSFQGHVDPEPVDGPAAFGWQADKGGPQYYDNAEVGPEYADAAMRMAGAKDYTLVKGWFEDTLAAFVPPSPIAVLRIDCDWYKGAMTCMRALFPHLADEGILIADGYPDWDGYARAIHQYLAEYPGPTRINRTDSGLFYVVKGAREWDE